MMAKVTSLADLYYRMKIDRRYHFAIVYAYETHHCLFKNPNRHAIRLKAAKEWIEKWVERNVSLTNADCETCERMISRINNSIHCLNLNGELPDYPVPVEETTTTNTPTE